MYLGVHSPLDIIVGTIFGIIFGVGWHRVGKDVWELLVGFPGSNVGVGSSWIHVVSLAVIGLSLVWFHPRSETTPSYSRAMVMLSLAMGIVMSANLGPGAWEWEGWDALVTPLAMFPQWGPPEVRRILFR